MNPIFQFWQEWIGHLREQNVKCLQEKSTSMVRSNNTHPYTDSILEKMKEKPHNKPSPCREYPLKYIHTDITRLFPVLGYNGCQYWVMFFDDVTQLSTTIPIIYKSEMFAEFRKFLTKYKQLKRWCHRIRLDNSSENQSNKFRQWYAQQEISIEVTITNQH